MASVVVALRKLSVSGGRDWALLLVIAVVSAGFVSAASAADRGILADAECVVVAMHMATQSNPRQRSSGVMIATYYLGRLDGRSEHMDVERLIEVEAKKMTAAQIKAMAAPCGEALREKGREMERISADLSGRG